MITSTSTAAAGAKAAAWGNMYMYIRRHVYMYVCMCVYIYIYIHTYTYSYVKAWAPEIYTSEIIVDFQCQWHFPMDIQWHFRTSFHCSAVCSKGLSLVQWMFTGIV